MGRLEAGEADGNNVGNFVGVVDGAPVGNTDGCGVVGDSVTHASQSAGHTSGMLPLQSFTPNPRQNTGSSSPSHVRVGYIVGDTVGE